MTELEVWPETKFKELKHVLIRIEDSIQVPKMLLYAHHPLEGEEEVCNNIQKLETTLANLLTTLTQERVKLQTHIILET